jgi:SNF2 family DNA or RNA helicase
MTRTLRPYQAEAVDFVKAKEAAALFMDMGLGKTATMLHAILSMPRPVVLIGPIRVIENVWAQEAKLWPATQGLTFSLVRGSPAARRQALDTGADIYLVNPEVQDEVLEWAPTGSTLVIDESTLYKNPSAKRFKALRKHLKKFARRFILTGTPMPNSLMDLWSQVFILDRGERLDTAFHRFKSRFFRQTDYMGYVFEPVEGADKRVTDLIGDIALRIEAKDYLPAREVIHNPVFVGMPASARKLYEKLEEDAFATLRNEKTITGSNAAANLMKLRQVASGFVYNDDQEVEVVHQSKIEAVGEILDQTSSPVVLVYHFQHELDALRKAFPHAVSLNEWNQEDWDAGEIDLLLLHPQSGGHGLNLQYGSHVMIILSASFSYEHMAQTMGRIDRSGQDHPVVFHHIRTLDTVDDLLASVLDSKERNQASLLQMVKDYVHEKTDRH